MNHQLPKQAIPILEFKHQARLSLTEAQKVTARRSLNQYWLDDTECNIWSEEDNTFVAKHPEKETPEFRSAVYQLLTDKIVPVTLILYSDGNIYLKPDKFL